MRLRPARPAPCTTAVTTPRLSGATRRLRRGSWTVALTGVLVTGLGTSVAAAPEELTETTNLVVPGGKNTGAAVDFDGDYAIFTAKRASADGSVVVAHRTGTGADDWEQTTLTAPEGVTNFGVGVGIDAASGRAVVSALHTPALFVYTLAADGTWSGPERIDVTDPLAGRNTYGHVGERLDLDGNQAVVTAPNARVGTFTDAGAAYVVDLDTRLSQTYVSSSPRAYGIFGQAVAIEGSTLVASELQVNGEYSAWPVPGTYRLGRVQVFDTAAPAQPSVAIDYPVTEKTRPAGSASTMPFGVSLAIDDGRVYVGAPDEYNFVGDDHLSLVEGGNGQSVVDGSTTQGAVYVFDASSGDQLGGKITAPAGSFTFGAQVEVDGEALLASAYNLHPEEYGKGEVYVYDLATVTFGAPDAESLGRQAPAPVQRLRPTDTPDESLFGLGGSGEGGIVVSGTTAVVGSPYLGSTGTVTVFEPILEVDDRVLTLSDTTVVYGEHATVVASTDVDGVDGGEVVFTVDGVESAPVAVEGHVASLALGAAAHDVATYDVTAAFTQTSGAGLAAAATATHTVTPASTTVQAEVTVEEPMLDADTAGSPTATGVATAGSVSAEPSTSAAAETVLLSGTVSTQHSTAATGTVQLWDGDTLLASTPLDAENTFIAEIPVDATARTVTVRYPGDLNHLPSDTALDVAATTTVLPAPDPTTPVPTSTTEPTTSTTTADDLATTGASVAGIITVASLLLLAGAVTVTTIWSRRRTAA